MKTNENTQAEQSPKNAGVGPAKALALEGCDNLIEFHREYRVLQVSSQDVRMHDNTINMLNQIKAVIEKM